MFFNYFYSFGYRFSRFTRIAISIQHLKSKLLENKSCKIELIERPLT
jgi:hypothetical protein